jgi:hypothetical protein
MDGRCQEHLELESPVSTLGPFGTCSYRFVSGVRSGLYCPLFAMARGEPCEMHQRITDDTHAGKLHCAHKYTQGNRKDCYCTSPVEIQGKCWSHHMATEGLDAPRGIDGDSDYAPKPTCKYQFTRGSREGKYCPHNAGDTGYCYKHRATPDRPPKKEKVRVPKEPCVFTMRGGKRAGQECGKRADPETHLCRTHAHHKGKCLQVEKVVITKYRPCCRKIREGVRCGEHMEELPVPAKKVTVKPRDASESDSE